MLGFFTRHLGWGSSHPHVQDPQDDRHTRSFQKNASTEISHRSLQMVLNLMFPFMIARTEDRGQADIFTSVLYLAYNNISSRVSGGKSISQDGKRKRSGYYIELGPCASTCGNGVTYTHRRESILRLAKRRGHSVEKEVDRVSIPCLRLVKLHIRPRSTASYRVSSIPLIV